MKLITPNVYKYNDHRDYFCDLISLNNHSLRSFSYRYSEYFSHVTLSKLLGKNNEGCYKHNIKFTSETFYSFMKEIGLLNDECDFLLLVKLKTDTIDLKLKRSYQRTITSIIEQNKNKNFKKIKMCSDYAKSIAKAFDLINSHCQRRLRLDALKYVKHTALRTTNQSVKTELIDVLNKLQ